MSVNPDHEPTIRQPLTDPEGNPLPPLEVRSPQPNFGDDAQGSRIREAHKKAEMARKQRRKRIIAGVAGGAALLAGGTVAYAVVNHNNDSSASAKDLNNTDPIEDALAVDGNTHPELANPEYDKQFGIRELNKDGTLDAEKLFEQIGVVEVPVAVEDIGPMTEAEDESTKHGREVLGKALDSYLPNFEAIANLYNMNNPEVQATRALDETLPEEQRLLLSNANVTELLPTTLASFASQNSQQVLPAPFVSLIGELAPGDASLRAVACPFYGEAPTVCAQAQEEDPNFAQYSSAYDDDNEGDTQVQQNIGELSDGTMDREIRKNVRVGIVWVDAQGNKVSTSETQFTAQIGTIDGHNDMDRYLSFRAL